MNKQLFKNSKGQLFENETAYYIYNLIFELLSNINCQTEILINLFQTFQSVDFQDLELKDRKRLESIESWSKDILDNINSFHLEKMRKFTPKFTNEAYSVSELNEEFDRIVNFMLKSIESEEFYN